MKKVIKLTERDLTRIVKRVISEQEGEKRTYKLSPEEEKEKKSVKIYYDKSKLEGLKKDISEIAEFSIETINELIDEMGDIENFNKSGQPLDIDSARKALSVFLNSVINIYNGDTFEYPNKVEFMGQTFDGKVLKNN
jgi:hypothetical protein